jgi:hypothetical protein
MMTTRFRPKRRRQLWIATATNSIKVKLPAAGVAQATDCAAWLDKLSGYIKHADPKGTNAKLHTSAETFNALRQSLNVEFPQISARSPHAKSPE